MRLVIKTNVKTPLKKVFERFDLDLFKALKPPFVGLEVERFDGCQPKNEVHLLMNTFGLKQKWISVITETVENDQEIFFIDEGALLPTPLVFWRHKHRMVKVDDNTTTIIDDITYRSFSKFLDPFLYPAFWVMFSLRGPVYKDYFGA